MLYINYLTIIIIYINILFSSLIIIHIFINKLAQKHTKIKQYYIKNWPFTIFCVYFYIFFPVIGLYIFRLYNIHKSLDLKILYYNIKNLFPLDIIMSSIFVISAVGIIILLLSIMIINKELNNQIFNFFLFVQYNCEHENKLNTIIQHCNDCGYSDLISFSVVNFSHYLTKRLAYYKLNLTWEKTPDILSPEYDKKSNIFYDYCKKRPWYHFDIIITTLLGNKYYDKFIFPFSPLFIILYDCIFNNWLITHVYYYLIIYIPLMLFRRITINLVQSNRTIRKLIWSILYKKEACIYALPQNHHKLFDIYIANGIKSVKIDINAVGMDFDVSWFISKSAQFIYNQQENIYYNGVDKSLELLPDKRLVYRYTDYDSQLEFEEEWFLIAVKYIYQDDNENYALIVHINENNI